MVALEALGIAHGHQVAPAGMAHRMHPSAARLGQQPAGRQLQRVARHEHAPRGIDQSQHHITALQGALCVLLLHRVEDGRHLVSQLELQAQHAHDAPARVHTPGIDQGFGTGAAKAMHGMVLDIARIALQHRTQEGGVGIHLVEPAHRAHGTQAGTGLQVGVEKEDVAVDRVLAGVLGQARLDQRAQGRVRVGEVLGNTHVGGEEADVGRALEQVAHQHVDAHLGAGGQVFGAVFQGFADQALHQVAGEGREVPARLGQVTAR